MSSKPPPAKKLSRVSQVNAPETQVTDGYAEDEKITDLRNKMQSQEEELLRGKTESERLRAQLGQAEIRNDQTVVDLDEKVNTLTEICEKTSRQGEKQTSDMGLLSEKYNTLAVFPSIPANSATEWKRYMRESNHTLRTP